MIYQAHFQQNFADWRELARTFLQNKISPQEINWDQNQKSLLIQPIPEADPNKIIFVPPHFLKLAKKLSHSRYSERWDLLYRLLYRMNFEEKNLLQNNVDPDVSKANLIAKSVSRDIHKMHAFVRFKKTIKDNNELYMAWHKPEHLIVPLAAPFFARRFGDRPWTIFTPDQSAHWNGKSLTYFEGISQEQFNVDDTFDEAWKAYYSSIYNPARINLKAMKQEMAPKYWSTLPEVSEIKRLIQNNPQRLLEMQNSVIEKVELPNGISWKELQQKALQCQQCSLHKNATQTVWGYGDSNSDLMIVGDSPGETEDGLGKAFQGAAMDRLFYLIRKLNKNPEDFYYTYAVKHIKRRINSPQYSQILKPSWNEMGTCQIWLEAEINKIKPKAILALGRIAATSVLGRLPQISSDRKQLFYSSKYQAQIQVSWDIDSLLKEKNRESKQCKIKDLSQDLRSILSSI